MNRYTRDEILKRGLQLADAPTVEARDMPGGAIHPDAMSITWLQEGIDFFHHIYPFGGTLTSQTVTIDSSQSITLPSDFILDLRNGLLVETDTQEFSTGRTPFRRCRRASSFNQWLTRDIAYQAQQTRQVQFWYIVVGKVIKYTPQPDRPREGVLWYYALPNVLDADMVPTFPTDHTLIQYISLKAGEWINQYQPGTAQAFAQKEIARLKASGLLNDIDDDAVPFDAEIYPIAGLSRHAWMGDF